MAANFKITIHPNGDMIQLKVKGYFDGISAHELINIFNECRRHTIRIYIQTNGLREINPFGLAVFQDNLKSLNGRSLELAFSGQQASQFAGAAPLGTDLVITQSEASG
jgi:anti-anti-sigma regulatory factor